MVAHKYWHVLSDAHAKESCCCRNPGEIAVEPQTPVEIYNMDSSIGIRMKASKYLHRTYHMIFMHIISFHGLWLRPIVISAGLHIRNQVNAAHVGITHRSSTLNMLGACGNRRSE